VLKNFTIIALILAVLYALPAPDTAPRGVPQICGGGSVNRITAPAAGPWHFRARSGFAKELAMSKDEASDLLARFYGLALGLALGAVACTTTPAVWHEALVDMCWIGAIEAGPVPGGACAAPNGQTVDVASAEMLQSRW
jgi:hypothetical protein